MPCNGFPLDLFVCLVGLVGFVGFEQDIGWAGSGLLRLGSGWAGSEIPKVSPGSAVYGVFDGLYQKNEMSIRPSVLQPEPVGQGLVLAAQLHCCGELIAHTVDYGHCRA